MDKRISIVVPIYNREKTLEKCVSSLLAQTYRNIEIILVNDGSKDRSLSVCYELGAKDDRIQVVDKPNGGVSTARNAGLEAARGDFVMFCDSDDWVEPDWCACLYANYREDCLTICEIGGENSSEPENPSNEGVEEAERSQIFHYPSLMCSPVNKIFSLRVITDNKLRFSEKLRLGEDFSFVLSYLCAITGGLRILHKELYHYDASTVGSLSKQAQSLEQCALYYENVFGAMQKLNVQDSQSYATAASYVTGFFINALISVSKQQKLSLSEKMALAGKVSRMESYRRTCGHGMEWENPVLIWLYRQKKLRFVMLYLLLRSLWSQLHSHSEM